MNVLLQFQHYFYQRRTQRMVELSRFNLDKLISLGPQATIAVNKALFVTLMKYLPSKMASLSL